MELVAIAPSDRSPARMPQTGATGERLAHSPRGGRLSETDHGERSSAGALETHWVVRVSLAPKPLPVAGLVAGAKDRAFDKAGGRYAGHYTKENAAPIGLRSRWVRCVRRSQGRPVRPQRRTDRLIDRDTEEPSQGWGPVWENREHGRSALGIGQQADLA